MKTARLAPALTVLVLVGPLLFGLAGTLLPAFGYLPALGGTRLTFRFFGELLASPGILRSALLALAAGVATTAIAFLVTLSFVASWAGTGTFARLQHMVSPLLSIPHAAAAFGLAFLVTRLRLAPAAALVRDGVDGGAASASVMATSRSSKASWRSSASSFSDFLP